MTLEFGRQNGENSLKFAVSIKGALKAIEVMMETYRGDASHSMLLNSLEWRLFIEYEQLKIECRCINRPSLEQKNHLKFRIHENGIQSRILRKLYSQNIEL